MSVAHAINHCNAKHSTPDVVGGLFALEPFRGVALAFPGVDGAEEGDSGNPDPQYPLPRPTIKCCIFAPAPPLDKAPEEDEEDNERYKLQAQVDEQHIGAHGLQVPLPVARAGDAGAGSLGEGANDVQCDEERPSQRGGTRKKTCLYVGKVVRIRRVGSRYDVTQTKMGEMAISDALTAYSGIEAKLSIDALHTDQPAVEMTQTTNSGIVSLSLSRAVWL
ncbi:hypothetical protein AYL99_11944 [Fonsecaea erecta]|uniref:Uncharacterized protein n=1 Tax=Fonsecaea erecta TaxID=1367422 RepID=A0A178Z2C0_9EURO|nr:hypothetical protein AYL99_11944 [Fonsecaea erecta]OAP53922.1 hypothetical protein AYL99_11944 [Fonsecaea erecta]